MIPANASTLKFLTKKMSFHGISRFYVNKISIANFAEQDYFLTYKLLSAKEL